MNEQKHKILSILIISIGTLLGFEAISYAIGLYQLKTSLYLSFYIYAFHIFWLTFLFDLHLKNRDVLANSRLNYEGFEMLWSAFKDRFAHIRSWKYLRHYQNYLVLPGLLYWSTVILLFLNPFNTALKEVIVLLATAAGSIAYWHMKEHISHKFEVRIGWVKTLAPVKLYAAFSIYSAVIGTVLHFGFASDFLAAAVFAMTFLLVYQALFQYNLLSFRILLWLIVMALVMSMTAIWVKANWNAEYFTGGLVMLAVYNTLWGILHHHLDQTLTRKVVLEYVVMLVLIISILFASHNFNQRVI